MCLPVHDVQSQHHFAYKALSSMTSRCPNPARVRMQLSENESVALAFNLSALEGKKVKNTAATRTLQTHVQTRQLPTECNARLTRIIDYIIDQNCHTIVHN